VLFSSSCWLCQNTSPKAQQVFPGAKVVWIISTLPEKCSMMFGTGWSCSLGNTLYCTSNYSGVGKPCRSSCGYCWRRRCSREVARLSDSCWELMVKTRSSTAAGGLSEPGHGLSWSTWRYTVPSSRWSWRTAWQTLHSPLDLLAFWESHHFCDWDILMKKCLRWKIAKVGLANSGRSIAWPTWRPTHRSARNSQRAKIELRFCKEIDSQTSTNDKPSKF